MLQEQHFKFRPRDEKINFLLQFYQNFMKDITFQTLNTCDYDLKRFVFENKCFWSFVEGFMSKKVGKRHF